jgi:oligoribonuclease
MDPVVKNMHATSRLDRAVRESDRTVAEAEERVLAYVREFVPDARKAPLCGNSIATDRAFIARYMPALDAHLHYRMVDVSSVKELVRRWYPRVYYAAPPKRGGHRALADIQESIEELRYYRAAVFAPQPGPSTEAAREISADIRAETDAQFPNTEAPEGTDADTPEAPEAPGVESPEAPASDARAPEGADAETPDGKTPDGGEAQAGS